MGDDVIRSWSKNNRRDAPGENSLTREGIEGAWGTEEPKQGKRSANIIQVRRKRGWLKEVLPKKTGRNENKREQYEERIGGIRRKELEEFEEGSTFATVVKLCASGELSSTRTTPDALYLHDKLCALGGFGLNPKVTGLDLFCFFGSYYTAVSRSVFGPGRSRKWSPIFFLAP